jgi:hypothetical protein
MQRHDLKEKYNLDGDCVTDCLKAWCCGCCDLYVTTPLHWAFNPLTGSRIQQDKEAAYHTLNSTPMVEANQPVVKENMIVGEQGPVQG